MSRSSVCVVTSSRADYYLLRPLLIKLSEDQGLELSLVATGSHLSEALGNTVACIENDGFSIDRCIPILEEEDSRGSVERSFARAVVSFGEYFSERPCSLLIILGDRFEMLAVASGICYYAIMFSHAGGLHYLLRLRLCEWGGGSYAEGFWQQEEDQPQQQPV